MTAREFYASRAAAYGAMTIGALARGMDPIRGYARLAIYYAFLADPLDTEGRGR